MLIETAMSDLETQLTSREPDTLERLLLGGSGTRETAGRLARLTGGCA